MTILNNKNSILPLFGSKSHWSCGFCQANSIIQRLCCTNSCNHSTFANKTIEQMIGHLVHAHGYKPPKGWSDLNKTAKNKQPKKKKKRKKN